MKLGALASLRTWYGRQLTERPLITKVLTAGVVFSTGDLLSQKALSSDRINFKRTAYFAAMGMCYYAPLLHWNFSIMLPKIAPITPGCNMTVITLKKLAFDQFIFAPVITAGFFPLINLLEGRGLEAGISALKEKYMSTMAFNMMLWLPAASLNFYFVPIPYQVLFVNLVSVGYNCMLSSIHNK